MKGNHIVIGNLVENVIHCIINHNLLLTTNFNIIVMIEEHNTILPELIIIGTRWENVAIFIVEYLQPKLKTTQNSV